MFAMLPFCAGNTKSGHRQRLAQPGLVKQVPQPVPGTGGLSMTAAGIGPPDAAGTIRARMA
jgi:hypothetical protein